MPQSGWWEVSALVGHSLPCPLTVELWRGDNLVGTQNFAPFPASPPGMMMAEPPAGIPMPKPLSLGNIHHSDTLELKFRPSDACSSKFDYVTEENADFQDFLSLLDENGDGEIDGWIAGWVGFEPFWLVEIFLEIKPIDPPVNPAISIHGLGGQPEDWTTGNKKMYWERLNQEGWPQSYRASYAYADYNNDGEYDYQGDIREIENDLPDLVNQLADEYVSDSGNCQNGCVDLAGFSLGGMVARQYLNEHPFDHKVRKLVTIGSPHRGSFILEPLDWLENLHLENTFIGEALVGFAEDRANNLRNPDDEPISADSPAVQQIRPSSTFLAGLNNFISAPSQTELLYGNIDARLKQELFFFELEKEFSVGDGLISVDSATGAPFQDKKLTEFSDPKALDIDVMLTREGDGFSLELDTLGPEDRRFYHEDLIKQPEVVDKVFDILASD